MLSKDFPRSGLLPHKSAMGRGPHPHLVSRASSFGRLPDAPSIRYPKPPQGRALLSAGVGAECLPQSGRTAGRCLPEVGTEQSGAAAGYSLSPYSHSAPGCGADAEWSELSGQTAVETIHVSLKVPGVVQLEPCQWQLCHGSVDMFTKDAAK